MSGDAARVVVGAAIVHRGRLLAQQRAWPAADAGRWELPGGRVEDGESETDALVRECAEELGVQVTPGPRIGGSVPLPGGRSVLRIYAATLISPGAEPRAVEHAAVRWLGADELTTVDWLDADRVLLPHLRALLLYSDAVQPRSTLAPVHPGPHQDYLPCQP
jgi:8-oxo-dGTP diphosphatase